MSKSVKLSSILVDSTAATEGVWVDIHPPFQIKVARANNPRFRSCFQRHLTIVMMREKVQEIDHLSEEAMDEITTRTMAETIAVDMRGLADEDDAEIPYSHDWMYEFLSNPDAYEHRQKVENAALTRDNYTASVEDEAIKKCEGESNGTSPTQVEKADISDS